MSEYQRLKSRNRESKEVRKEIRKMDQAAREFVQQVVDQLQDLIDDHLFEGHEVQIIAAGLAGSLVIGCSGCDAVVAEMHSRCDCDRCTEQKMTSH